MDHRFHHLRGGNGHFVMLAGELDHAFLQCRDGRVAHFHCQVTPCHHDAVADAKDVFQLRNGFCAFDFGNQAGAVAIGACHVAQLAGQLHVGCIFGEAHGHIVCLEGHGGADVIHVLGGQRRCGQAAALFVDPLVVGQLTAHHHGGVHGSAPHAVNLQHDQPVVQQQDIAGLHVAWQFLVVQAHTVVVTGFGACRIEHKRRTVFKLHLALGKFAHPDLGALQVGHDGHDGACALRGCPHHVGAVGMVLRCAM
jgi:hypothetical protein